MPEVMSDLGFFEAIYRGKPIARTAATNTIKYPKYNTISTKSII